MAFGDYNEGFTNRNVKAVEIFNYQMTPIFDFKLSANFPNLICIKISHSSIKQLRYNNFKYFEELLVVDLSYNFISNLPGYFFDHNNKLIYVNFDFYITRNFRT